MNSTLPPHLAKFVEAHERMFGVQIIDRTPAGYGPGPYAGELPERNHLTTEEQAIRRAISEGETILRGRMSADKRLAIENSVRQAKIKLETL